MTPEERLDLERAHRFLELSEVRRITVAGETVVGIWSNADSASIRGAIKVVGWDGLKVMYLDSPAVPATYKVSNLHGNPVPLEVLAAMEAASEEPWEVRDRLMSELARRTWTPSPVVEASGPLEQTTSTVEWRKIQHGYAIWWHWRRWHPEAADLHYKIHQSADDRDWLLWLGTDAQVHRLELLFDNLERHLKEVRGN
jgi:hypothetical protein